MEEVCQQLSTTMGHEATKVSPEHGAADRNDEDGARWSEVTWLVAGQRHVGDRAVWTRSSRHLGSGEGLGKVTTGSPARGGRVAPDCYPWLGEEASSLGEEDERRFTMIYTLRPSRLPGPERSTGPVDSSLSQPRTRCSACGATFVSRAPLAHAPRSREHQLEACMDQQVAQRRHAEEGTICL